MKIKEEIHFPTLHSAQSSTPFIIELRLIEENLKDDYGIDEIVEYWEYSCAPEQLKIVFERETTLQAKLNQEGEMPVNIQTAQNILNKTIQKAISNPNLIPYFYPKELSNENGQINNVLLEKFEGFVPVEHLDKTIGYSLKEDFIPFLKMEYLINIAIHIKSFLINDKKEVLSFFEEELLETEFTITEITEIESYKEFPNEEVAQKYFDITYGEGDRFFIYHIWDEEEAIKLCIVKSDTEKWKFFFCVREK